MTLAGLILGLVTLQRLGELALSKRNADRQCVQGANEVAAGHYPLIVALHTAWLTGLWYLVIYRAADSGSWVWLGVFVILQLLRVWVIATLGPRWTTRIIVLPGAPLVAVGPYRFVSHPNYWVVAAEILVLPLVFGLVWYGIAFSVLNAAVLWIRIRAEDTALTRRPEISRGTRAPTARAHSAHRGCTRSSSPGRADSCRGGIQGLQPIPWTQSSADDIHELRERERRPARSRRRVSVPKLSWSVFLTRYPARHR
jgi:methyltransferase